MADKSEVIKSEGRAITIYSLILVVFGILLLLLVLNHKPLNTEIPYTIKLVEDSSAPDTVQYTWHVVVQEPVRMVELKYIAENLVEEAKAGSSFTALEILIYDYPEYIGHGYTLARVVYAPQGDWRKANTVEPGDYNQMSIQWDVRDKVWEKQLNQDEVLIWKAWQDYYEQLLARGTTADEDMINKVIADKYKLEPSAVAAIRLKQEYWRYSNFDYLTR